MNAIEFSTRHSYVCVLGGGAGVGGYLCVGGYVGVCVGAFACVIMHVTA